MPSVGTKPDQVGAFIESMFNQKNEIALTSGSSRQKGAPGILASNDKILTYEELQRQILSALRAQNPDWVEPDGSSPIYESYQRRFAELLAFFSQQERRRASLPGRTDSLFRTDENNPLFIQ